MHRASGDTPIDTNLSGSLVHTPSASPMVSRFEEVHLTVFLPYFSTASFLLFTRRNYRLYFETLEAKFVPLPDYLNKEHTLMNERAASKRGLAKAKKEATSGIRMSTCGLDKVIWVAKLDAGRDRESVGVNEKERERGRETLLQVKSTRTRPQKKDARRTVDESVISIGP